jgi:hypothetical protein
MVALALSDLREEQRNWRPIRRTAANMMHGHRPPRVHENVAPQLVDVACGASQPVTPADQLRVRPPGGRSPDR